MTDINGAAAASPTRGLEMAEGTTQGILLMADISGYSEFVRQRTRSAGHAVFFYALGLEAELPELAEQVKNQIPRLFRAFRKEIKVLSSASDCSCHACSCIAALRRKQVIHSGEVAVGKIGRFEKLFGLAVIFVHRMLKNTVPASEYLMFSEPAFSNIDDFFGLEPERRVVELEGIGEHRTVVFYAEQLASVQERLDNEEGPIPDPSVAQVLRWKLGLMIHTLVDMVTGRSPRAKGVDWSHDGPETGSRTPLTPHDCGPTATRSPTHHGAPGTN